MPASEAQTAVTVSMFAQRFSATRRGARLARRLAVHQLGIWGIAQDSPVSESVALVVAELSSNAVLHGRVPGRDFGMRLLCDRERGVVRVEISDTHPAQPLRLLPPADSDGGRWVGLLVQAVSSVWG
ncbi:ATP-binding protein, partial [Streptomyces sp. NPDC055078]